MRYFVLFVSSFLILTAEISAANKLEESKIYSGTLSNLYQKGNVLPLPPGDWKITKLEKNRERTSIYAIFKHIKSFSYVYVTLPTTIMTDGRWLGGKYVDCPNNIVAKNHKNIKNHFGMKDQYDYWCATSTAFYNTKAGNKFFRMNLNLELHNLSNSEIAHYAKLINDQFIEAFNGNKSANLDFLSAILEEF